jgi:Rps23 Pro-64 3,4-dihydroxylase Tpa1-like proline 4-hydroxylase
MLIINNALSDNTLNEVDNFFINSLQDNVWKTSDVFWDPSLNRSSTGIIAQAKCSDNLSVKIGEELKNYFPKYNYLEINLYVWHKNSSISLHCDSNSIFGATIYLNQFWHPEWGGMFIWYDFFENKNSDDVFVTQDPNIIMPKRNTMILNNKSEYHMVSNINPCAQDNRYTLQIWGKC